MTGTFTFLPQLWEGITEYWAEEAESMTGTFTFFILYLYIVVPLALTSTPVMSESPVGE